MAGISVLAINGSPRRDGTTARLLKRFLGSAERRGASTKLVHLADKEIRPCLGCYSADPEACRYPCRQKDGMQPLYRMILKADALVFGTPVYWFNMSGQMKNMMDRFCCLASQGYKLEGKVGVFIADSKEDEGGRALASIMMASTMNHLGLLIPPYGIMFYPGVEEVVKKGKTVSEDWMRGDSEKIAGNLVKLCSFLKKSRFKW